MRQSIIYLIIPVVLFFSCVTEPVDAPADGKAYLDRELAKVIKRLPLRSGMELYSDLNRLIAFGDFAIEPMMGCLEDSNSKVRSSAAFVLGQLRAVDALDTLLDLTEDRDKLVRYEAARAVMEIGAWDTIPLLIEGLADESPFIRYLCIQALNRGTKEHFNYHYDGSEEDRGFAIEKWHIWWNDQKDNPAYESNLAAG